MKYLLIAAGAVIVLVVTFISINKVSPVSWGWWGTTHTTSGVALGGHDPVSYFEAGTPAKGSAEWTHDWADATWHFASAENRDTFAANPARYAPQFGGFCSFAVSKGFTAKSDPEAWHVEDGKLFVFADRKVRDTWVSALDEGVLQASNSNWAKR